MDSKHVDCRTRLWTCHLLAVPDGRIGCIGGNPPRGFHITRSERATETILSLPILLITCRILGRLTGSGKSDRMQAWGVLGSSDRSTRSSTVLKSYTPGSAACSQVRRSCAISDLRLCATGLWAGKTVRCNRRVTLRLTLPRTLHTPRVTLRKVR